MPSKLVAQWTQLASSVRLQRSSQCLSVLGTSAIISGGEVKPREPVDNQVDVIELNVDKLSPNEAPPPRVGSASAEVGGNIYLFSGLKGVVMAPVDEKGALWKYTANPESWSLVHPASSSEPFPSARSYHTMTSDGDSTLYMHAGCPESGRLSDLWSFNVQSRKWKELASAPDPPRGGTSIAFSGGKLYRMNGFDGIHEQGGAVDTFDPARNSWSSVSFSADNISGPGARSVSALVPVNWNNRNELLTMFGEQDPSALGHAGAGKMRSDVWAWDIDTESWTDVRTQGSVLPDGRGWFAADVLKQTGRDTVIVHVGLAEGNNRLGDVWALTAVQS